MSLYRKAALDKMASPERLDELVRVTSPLGWLALGTVGAILLAVVIWSFVGEIPTRVAAEGLLLPGEYFMVEADAGGRLERLDVRVGETVLPRQVIGTIKAIEVESELTQTARDLDQAKRDCSRARSNFERIERDSRDALSRIRRQIETTETDLAREKGNLDNVNKPRRIVEDAITRLEEKLDALFLESGNLERRVGEEQRRFDQACNQADDIEGDLQAIRAGEHLLEIRAPMGGTVRTILKNPGENINRGDDVARIFRTHDEGLRTLVYVPSTSAGSIRVGQDVEVSPSGIKREEYGFIKGRVVDEAGAPGHAARAVSPVLTRTELMKELVSEDRVGKITKQKAVVRVLVELGRCDTPTGFCWSSGQGPAVGQLTADQDLDVQANIVTRRVKPIVTVIPFLKKILGVS